VRPRDVESRLASRGGLAAWFARIALRLVFGSLLPGAAGAGEPPEPLPAATVAVSRDDPLRRPRIALVLSGGGARGFAHIGALRALEDMRVPVDLVIGTSMGAAIGGAWAAGASVEARGRLVRETDWDAILSDRPPRASLSVRRRADEIDVPSRIEVGIGSSGLIAPPSAISSQALEAAIRQALPPGAGDRSAASQPVPFAAVATDLLTGRPEVLRDVPLQVAIRASLTVPGLFSPYRHEGRLLVDGGLVENLPIELARSLGADVVIAVNAGQVQSEDSEGDDAVAVTRRMIAILTEQNVDESLRMLAERDVLVTPRLGTLGTLDLRAGVRAIDAGARAVTDVEARLAPLALGPQAYAAFASGRLAAPPPVSSRILAGVRVVGTRRADPMTLVAESGLRTGQAATFDEIRDAADRLYGRGDFERVEVAVEEAPEGRLVTLAPVESAWLANRLRLGMQFATDFREAHSANLAALHVLPWRNAWGAEWRTFVRAGTQLEGRTEWWQPLGPGSPWYASTLASYASGTEVLYDAWRPRALFATRTSELRLSAGRSLGRLGVAELGLARRVSAGRLVLPDSELLGQAFQVPLLEGGRYVDSIGTARMRIDTLEPLAFPVRGSLLSVELERSLDGPAPGVRPLWGSVAALQAARYDAWAGHLYAEWTSGPAQVGGLLRSSGLPVTVSASRSTLLLRGVAARQIGTMPVGWGGAVRIGGSLEWLDAPGWGALGDGRGSAAGGSVFASIDTRLGPLYVGLGHTHGFSPALRLILGPIW
jgi:NTE family protein